MAMEQSVTRVMVFTLDPTPAQERLLRSYCGAARFAYNWAIGQVNANLEARAAEREAGIPEAQLTPALSWSAFSLSRQWNASKSEAASWWREVSKHAFGTGIASAAAALDGFSKSRKGLRRGRRMGFPRFKSRRREALSVSFVEINHQLSWLTPDRHHVRLMLPRSSPDPAVRRRAGVLAWIHTVESTRRLYRLVETGRASIQKVTICYRGGRWQAAFSVRYLEGLQVSEVRQTSRLVGLDAGVRHLVTLSTSVPGLTDVDGHVPNPNCLGAQRRRLARLDRAISRCEDGSHNRVKLLRRRARLHGRIAKTRALELHRVTNSLVNRFGVVAIEDLNVAGMWHKKRRLGRRLADASLGELRRQLTYKSTDRGRTLVVVDRFFPSSKTCSGCGAVKAKLPLWIRVYECEECGLVLDRDVNAARNIAREACRLLGVKPSVAGLRPETQNADPRLRKTETAPSLTGGDRLRAEPSSHPLAGVA